MGGRRVQPRRSGSCREVAVSNDVALKMKQKQYEATVIDFVQNQKGRFIVVTDDQAFLSVLRTAGMLYGAIVVPWFVNSYVVDGN